MSKLRTRIVIREASVGLEAPLAEQQYNRQPAQRLAAPSRLTGRTSVRHSGECSDCAERLFAINLAWHLTASLHSMPKARLRQASVTWELTQKSSSSRLRRDRSTDSLGPCGATSLTRRRSETKKRHLRSGPKLWTGPAIWNLSGSHERSLHRCPT